MKIYKKKSTALPKNIHYTILLPVLSSINKHKEFIFRTPPSTLQEKELLNNMLKNSTTMFCLCYMLLKSPVLNEMIKEGFANQNGINDLFYLLANTVNGNKIAANCLGTTSPEESIKMLGVIEQIQWIHKNVPNF